MKNLQKGSTTVVILSIIVVLLVVSFGYYVYSQNINKILQPQNIKNETSKNDLENQPSISKSSNQNTGLETYKNDQYGFELQYPTDLAVAAGVNGVNSSGEKVSENIAVNKDLMSWSGSKITDNLTKLQITVYVKDPKSTKWDNWNLIGTRTSEKFTLGNGVTGLITTGDDINSNNVNKDLSSIEFISDPLIKGKDNYKLIFELDGIKTSEIENGKDYFKKILMTVK